MREVIYRRFATGNHPLPPPPGTYQMVLEHHMVGDAPHYGETFTAYWKRVKPNSPPHRITHETWVVEK